MGEERAALREMIVVREQEKLSYCDMCDIVYIHSVRTGSPPNPTAAALRYSLTPQTLEDQITSKQTV